MWIAKKTCINKICHNGVALVHRERRRRDDPESEYVFMLDFYQRSQEDAMTIELLNACVAASLHTPYVSQVQFYGRTTNQKMEFVVSDMGLYVYCGNKCRFNIVFMSKLRVPKFEKTPDGFLSGITTSATDAAGDFFIKEVLDFAARGEWSGLMLSDNKYGFEVDYRDGENTKYQFNFLTKRNYVVEALDSDERT